MSALSELRRLLGTDTKDIDTLGVVTATPSLGRILVRTKRSTVSCSSLIPVAVGDSVRIQGSLIISRQVGPTDSLPEYKV